MRLPNRAKPRLTISEPLSRVRFDDYPSAMTTVPKKAAPKPSSTTRAGRVKMTATNGSAKARLETFQFGSATLKAPARPEDWDRNIALGQQAMKRIKRQLLKPGVKLKVFKSKPLFRTDPQNPSRLIRVLDGKETRGVFDKSGEFKVLP
jgi:hypothetical protein